MSPVVCRTRIRIERERGRPRKARLPVSKGVEDRTLPWCIDITTELRFGPGSTSVATR